MSRTDARPEAYPYLIQFRTKLQEFTILPEPNVTIEWKGTPFVRTQLLKEWLDTRVATAEPSHVDGYSGVSVLAALLHEAYCKYYEKDVRVPVNVDLVRRHCPLVFCILLEIDKGHLIKEFTRVGINDDLLNVYYQQLKEHIRRARVTQNESSLEELTSAFYKRKWAYKAHVFEYPSFRLDLEPEKVLPIYKREEICTKGSTALIHLWCIPEDFVQPDMRKKLNNKSFTTEIGKCYEIAVKIFKLARYRQNPSVNVGELFEREVTAYDHLKYQEGIVHCLGAFSQKSLNGAMEYNILLEFGDYDLAEYFLCHPPVLLTKNVLEFWRNLINVVHALAKVHRFTIPNLGREDDYIGWHADIKPDNILSVKGVLKLADPGFAEFARYVDGPSLPRTAVVGMTSTYGAPECYTRDQETNNPHAADIWSLGCVLSEAATWITLGPPGLEIYASLRRKAVDQHRHRNRSNVGRGDYFHNGTTVLAEIAHWHQYLRKQVRSSDPITTKVLTIIDRHLLRSNPQDRLGSQQLCQELESIKNFSQPPESLPPLLEDAIDSIERNTGWQPTISDELKKLSIQERKALKSKPVLPGADDADEVDLYRSGSIATRQTSSRYGDARSSDYQIYRDNFEVLTPPVAPDVDERGRAEALTSRQSNRRKGPKHKPQSLFEAHYIGNSQKQKDEKKGFLRRMSIRAPRRSPDEFLRLHYTERDIKFLVDNSSTMLNEWAAVRFVLETLARKAAWLDKDGMDLEFAQGGTTIKLMEDNLTSTIEKAMGDAVPKSGTDLSVKIGRMLLEWLEIFQKKGTKAKTLTIIALTDGQWTWMKKPTDMEDKIVEFDRSLKKIDGSGLLKRPVSIQFVSFGQDEQALSRLQRLDDDLKFEKQITDIVDAEPWDGDVYKMLLGSFIEDIDDQDEKLMQEEVLLSATSQDSRFTQSAYQTLPQSPHSERPFGRQNTNHSDLLSTPRSSRHSGLQGADLLPNQTESMTSEPLQTRIFPTRDSRRERDLGEFPAERSKYVHKRVR